MLTLSNKQVQVNDEITTTSYKCNGTYTLSNGTVIELQELTRNDEDIYEDGTEFVTHIGVQYTVQHAANNEDVALALYNEAAFEQLVSKALGYDVCFTESGMQDDEYASMELA